MTAPSAPLLRGCVVDSFAFRTIKDRLPVILTKIVDRISRRLHEEHMARKNNLINSVENNNQTSIDESRYEEAKQIMDQIAALKYAMVRDRQLELLHVPSTANNTDSDLLKDVQTWNAALMAVPETDRTWFRAPWLLIECYMYRLIRKIVLSTTHWTNYDPFEDEKRAALAASNNSILQLSQFVASITPNDDVDKQLVLRDLIQFSLWGNQSDLSLLVNLHHKDLHKLQLSDRNRLAASESNIIVNDLDRVVNALLSPHKPQSTNTIVFVLDNAGFELFADLCLADYLTRLLNCNIVLESKSYPWFVSDTTPADISYTLDWCTRLSTSQLQTTGSVSCLAMLVDRWRSWLDNGTWRVQSTSFWTTPAPFWHLPDQAPDLLHQLSESRFIFFKGDLNYRKMVHDALWTPTTLLPDAMGPLALTRIAPFVMLRTCKSDTVVGLRQGQSEVLDQADKDWMVNGKYGMIQSFGL